jgi:2-dehydro-3-deoxy-D-arabinonate dehydratase
MILIRFRSFGNSVNLGLISDDRVYDLSSLKVPHLQSLSSLLSCAEPLSYLRSQRLSAARALPCSAKTLLAEGRDGEVELLPPIDAQEVWAAGVTYQRSEEARKAESEGAAAFYAKVYEAARPELFFKATPHRTVGQGAEVMIRQDSKWNVPEPELGVVLSSELQVLGYVIGNDMSSRDIEGENPLYLPQAKIYANSCALGPGILLADEVPDPKKLTIELMIQRQGEMVFEQSTSVSQMHRKIGDLIGYLGKANAFPHGVVLLTGTGIVPDDSFTLQENDTVQIRINPIGILKNRVAVARC